MLSRCLALVVASLVVFGCASATLPGTAAAHRDGCHAQHSCPSDTGSYVCGDTGNYSECPGMAGSVAVYNASPTFGTTLNGSVSWAAAPRSVSYQWMRGGAPIPGATTSSYTVAADDLGQTLLLTASGTDGRGQTALATSGPVNVAPLAGSVSLSADQATFGTQLSAQTSWNAPAAETFQWKRAGAAIAGATAATYIVGREDLGQAITVDVTGQAGSSVVTASTAAVTPTAPVTLRLTGPTRTLRSRVTVITGVASSPAPLAGRQVKVVISLRAGRTWKVKRTAAVTLSSAGTFRVQQLVRRSETGRWKAQASMAAGDGYLAARSPVRSFTVRR